MMEKRMLDRKRAVDAFSAEFKRKTGQSIGKFFNVVFGFDVVALDTWLEVPDGQSTYGVLVERYGEDFAEKVRSLI